MRLHSMNMKRNCLPYLLGMLLLGGAAVAQPTGPKHRESQPKQFRDWPAGTSPQEIGKRVVERYLSLPFQNFGRATPPAHVTYPETCTWYGALTFAQLAGNKDLTSRLAQ